MKLRLLTIFFIAASLHAQLSGVTKTPITGGPKFPNSIVAGPDGNTWFTDFKGNQVGRLTPGGTVTTFALPQPNSVVDTITAGLDGNMWFTEDAGRIGRITPAGAITEFPIGNAINPTALITGGADGALYFLAQPSTFPPPNVKLGRITTDGKITTYDLGSRDTIVAMLTGPDGNIWLYDTTKNAMVVFAIGKKAIAATHPVPSPAGDFTNKVILGLDGNLWFTHANNIARMKVDGTVTEYPVPTANAQPSAISVGGDGNIWFSEYKANKLGQLIVSTATDSGTATINESDAILDAGAIEMVPVTKRASTAGKTALPLDANDPCQSQTFVDRFTVAGVWYSISWTVPAERKCADVWTFVAVEENFLRGPATHGQASVKCEVNNAGPADATSVASICSGDGTLLDPAFDSISDPNCAFESEKADAGKSKYKITVPTLHPLGTCRLLGGLSTATVNNIWVIAADASTYDPYAANNIFSDQWNPVSGNGSTGPVLPTPVTRGPNH